MSWQDSSGPGPQGSVPDFSHIAPAVAAGASPQQQQPESEPKSEPKSEPERDPEQQPGPAAIPPPTPPRDAVPPPSPPAPEAAPDREPAPEPTPPAAPVDKARAEPAAAAASADAGGDGGEAIAKDLHSKLETSDRAASPEDEDDPLPVLWDRLRPDAFECELSVQQDNPNSPLYSIMQFEEMGLRSELLQGVYAAKYQRPSKIQSTAIPMIIHDPPRNLIGQAQSGTGKTAAFVLGMLSRIDPSLHQPQALCIVPTRELARQIVAVTERLGQFSGITFTRLIREETYPMGHRMREQVVVGTAGRVGNVMRRSILPTRSLRIFVLDEADVMLEMQGMGDQSVRIKRMLPPNIQTLLFSATFKPEVRKFALRMVPNPDIIQLKREQLSLEGIRQFFIDCQSLENKIRVLSDIYGFMTIGQSIIFVQTRRMAQILEQEMTRMGHAVSLLHGADMPGAERDRVIDQFREGRNRVLITTNVLSRGIDILQVSLVVNFDLPVTMNREPDPETYLHRIGRSGRFGRSGTAFNFVHDEVSRQHLRFYSEYFRKEITEIRLSALESIDEILRGSRT